MKKSNSVILGALFMVAVSSCSQQQGQSSQGDWITGYPQGQRPRDTTIGANQYRYYGNGWYPVRNGMIYPSYYTRPYTYTEISSHSFSPSVPSLSARGVSTGGFGSSAHASAGE